VHQFERQGVDIQSRVDGLEELNESLRERRSYHKSRLTVDERTVYYRNWHKLAAAHSFHPTILIESLSI
jgi:hypothetical protein